jgi:ABC-type branched-subunit amino acid transport system ATPase component
MLRLRVSPGRKDAKRTPQWAVMVNDNPFLRIDRLRAGYGDRTALAGISFEVGWRRSLSLVGPEGSGKSTLLSILAMDVAPGSSLWFNGGLILPPVPPRFLRQRPAGRPESFGMALAQVGGGSSPTDLLNAVWSAAPAAAATLAAIQDWPLTELPAALLRLAVLTLAIAGPPPFILLDEPEAGLDEGLQDWIVAALQSLRGRSTLVLATPHLDLAREVSDDIVLLDEGPRPAIQGASSSIPLERA